MEFIPVEDSEEHLAAFVTLEKEFTQHYVDLRIGEQYGRILPENLSRETLKSEFDEYLQKTDGVFFFAKEDGTFVAYIAGHIEPMPQGYELKKVGVISSMAVLATHRGLGIGTKLKDFFFAWLRSKGITMCQLYVKPENTEALKLYERWGFTVDEYRLWKPVE